jgi:hypothetical protein
VEAWLAILIAFVPPMVFATFRPHTEAWRRARRLFWATTALGAVTLGATIAAVAVVGPDKFLLGPAVGWGGALLLNCAALAVWCRAVGTIRSEWSDWRERQRTEAAAPEPARAPDPAKPWKK